MVVLVFLAFVLYIVAMWYGITALMSLLSGWLWLARTFPDATAPQEQTYTYQALRMGVVNYRQSINVRVAEDGLHLRTLALMSHWHRPILIPWSAIDSVRPKKGLFVTNYEVIIRSLGTRFIVSQTLGESILHAWEASGTM